MKTVRWMRVALADMTLGNRVWLGSDEWNTLEVFGLVTEDARGERVPTGAGREVGEAEAKGRGERRAAARKAARGRAEAMRSVGMVRTAYGWE